MKQFSVIALVVVALISFHSSVAAQEEARAVWQVTNFDLNVNVRLAERELSTVAVLKARNVGNAAATSFTVRLNPKATVRTMEVGGANANFRTVTETRGNLQRVTATLAAPAAPGATTSVTVTYSVPVETNTGLAAISPIATQFRQGHFGIHLQTHRSRCVAPTQLPSSWL